MIASAFRILRQSCQDGTEVSAILIPVSSRSDAACFQMLSCLCHDGIESLPAGVQNSTGPFQYSRQQRNLKARRAEQSYLAHPLSKLPLHEV